MSSSGPPLILANRATISSASLGSVEDCSQSTALTAPACGSSVASAPRALDWTARGRSPRVKASSRATESGLPTAASASTAGFLESAVASLAWAIASRGLTADSSFQTPAARAAAATTVGSAALSSLPIRSRSPSGRALRCCAALTRPPSSVARRDAVIDASSERARSRIRPRSLGWPSVAASDRAFSSCEAGIFPAFSAVSSGLTTSEEPIACNANAKCEPSPRRAKSPSLTRGSQNAWRSRQVSQRA